MMRLVRMEDLKNHKVELLDGDKKNSKWLLLDEHYICHLKDGETYFWECKQLASNDILNFSMHLLMFSIDIY